MQITQLFLNQIDKANKAFEMKKDKGFNYFNLFDALGISEKENYHSAFIAYLLNQNAEHFQSIFAQEFINKIRKDFINETKIPKNSLEVSNLKVAREAITENIKANRRMDILLNFADDVYFIIENKIYANDQISQLYDYVENTHKKMGAKLSEAERANRIVFIYLHPEKDALPSGLSLAKSANARKKIWSIEDKFIYDENGTRKAYFYKIDYLWIKEWLQNCLKDLRKRANSSDENGLNKIIFGINQYLDILAWYINDEFEDENSVKNFILSDNKFTQMALALLQSKGNEALRKVVEENWSSVCKEVISKFTKNLSKRKIKIANENLSCEEFDENSWIFYDDTKPDSLIRFYFGLECKSCELKYGWYIWFNDEEEEAKFEGIANECEEFFGKVSGIRKSRASYIKKISDDSNFAEWIIANGDKAEDLFIAKLKEFAENKAVQETKDKVEKYLAKKGY